MEENLQEIQKLRDEKELFEFALDHPDLTHDKEFILKAIKINSLVYSCFADPEIRGDRDIALAAAKASHYDFGYIMTNYSDLVDKEFVLEAAKDNGYILFQLKKNDSDLIKNRDIVLAAVKNEPRVLCYADEELRATDPEIMLTAVKGDSRNLMYADPNLRNNRDIALAAVIRNDEEIEYYTPEEKEESSVWPYIGDQLKEDAEFLADVEKSRQLSSEEAEIKMKLHTIVELAREAFMPHYQAYLDGQLGEDEGVSQRALMMLEELPTDVLKKLPSPLGNAYQKRAKEILTGRFKAERGEIIDPELTPKQAVEVRNVSDDFAVQATRDNSLDENVLGDDSEDR